MGVDHCNPKYRCEFSSGSKAVEDHRTPRRFASSYADVMREASWTAPALAL